MKSIDMRFDERVIEQWIRKRFIKYKCDPIINTDSVTGIVGIFIGDEVFKVNNIQETVDYFGTEDDYSVFTLERCEADGIRSLFDNAEQVETPVFETIRKMTIVNENQSICTDGVIKYDVRLTRALIFRFDGYELSFEKDNVPFSEEILIRKGHELEKHLSDEKDFPECWDDGICPRCSREYEVIG